MFLFLSKFLTIFVYPLSLAAILLVSIFIFRKQKWHKRLLIAAVLLIWIGGNGWVTGALLKSLEWKFLPPADTPAEMPEADAIVVLGGGTQPPDHPRQMPEVDGAGDRVIYGAQLFQLGKAPIVLVTGGRLPWSFAAESAAKEMASLMVFMGVPEEAILLEEQSVNTYENAIFTKDILEPIGIKRILLVTSAIHMPRSVAIFEKQGFEVIPAPTDFTITQPESPLPFSQAWPNYLFALFPSAHNLDQTTAAMKEYIGFLTYWVRGWL